MYSSKDTLFWTSDWAIAFIAWFEGIAWPCLCALAVLSSATAVIGFAGQFPNPDLTAYLRCAAVGFALFCITTCFWAACWTLPIMETRKALSTYTICVIVFFPMFWVVSSLGSLGATGSDISDDLVQSGYIDELDNTSQEFALFVSEIGVSRAALAERADQAFALETAEIAGNGPTGVPGVGSVSNSYGEAGRSYARAAATLVTVLTRAQVHVAAIDGALLELRGATISEELDRTQRAAQVKGLSRSVINEMRALRALDPARSITAAAQNIAQGVPARSGANGASQQRIAEINSGMRAYAATLEAEAERIAALAPAIPEQTTLSTAERLIATMWRMPGLTMSALLLDGAGFLIIFFRHAMYQALYTKKREETERPVASYITIDDFVRVAEFVEHAEDTKRRLEDAKNPPKRSRPRLHREKILPKPKGAPKRTSASKKKGNGDA
ncbi:MAG: hypothetical protein AAF943_08765 [Pseudomonadota bacterium]